MQVIILPNAHSHSIPNRHIVPPDPAPFSFDTNQKRNPENSQKMGMFSHSAISPLLCIFFDHCLFILLSPEQSWSIRKVLLIKHLRFV